MPATYSVPVERTQLDRDDPNRWLILPVDTCDPVEALRKATHTARHVFRLTGISIWAAVRDIPSFAYMQELRDSKDALKGVRLRHRRSERRIPGYA
jgi:hypothetical protein